MSAPAVHIRGEGSTWNKRNRDWALQDKLLVCKAYRPGSELVPDSGGYPFAIVICKNCSYTQLFNAVMMGILKKNEDENGPK